jgi:hypothetical protein
MEDGDLTALESMALQMHELLTAYVQAGFTREEALQLVIAIVTKVPS